VAKKKSLNKEGLEPMVFDLENKPAKPVRKSRAPSRKSADVSFASIIAPAGISAVGLPNETADKADKTEIIVNQPQIKSFNLRIAENQLDVYRSPHLLNLSEAGRIEKTKPEQHRNWPVEDMPAGKILSKFKILEFFDVSRSEIYLYLLRTAQIVRTFFLILFSRAKLESKLPARAGNSENKAVDRLAETSFVNLFLFAANQFYRVYLAAYKFFWLAYLFAGKINSRDQVIYLPRPGAEPQKAAIIDDLIQINEAPTIVELIKEYAPQTKIRPLPAPPSAREVREKYLEANPFLRRGVILNPQPPSMEWPKHQWNFSFSNFEFQSAVLRPAAVFCGILLALFGSVKIITYCDNALSVKGQVLGAAEQAAGNALQAGDKLKSFDLASAQTDFSSAQRDFQSARSQLDRIKSFITVLADIVPASNIYKSGKNTLEMGEHLSAAAAGLLSGINNISSSTDLSLSNRVRNFSLAVKPAAIELSAANLNAASINPSHLPQSSQKQFTKLKNALPQAVSALTQFQETLDFAAAVLGDNELRRYLLVFQNDNELRATGGFMGSYALVDFKNGKIEKITIPQGGTYDVRAGFNKLLEPPEPLRLVCSRWEFQDANWWPDWPTSAANIKWFYEKSGGPTIDGVIAVNSGWLKNLLRVTGPIDLPQYGKTVTADNFEEELQRSIELQAADKAKPKRILSELAPKILDKIFNLPAKDNLRLAEVVAGALKSSDIQLYFDDEGLQKFALKNDWAGALAAPAPYVDYLNVVATNIGGGKTDDLVRQKIYHQAEIQADGSVIDRVVISRYNASSKEDPLRKSANNTYLRVYVPAGSELLGAYGFKGFTGSAYKVLDQGAAKSDLLAEETVAADGIGGTKVYRENNYTVFANWTVIGPGESREVVLIYRLPFKIGKNFQPKGLVESIANLFASEITPYNFIFQKQSGRSQDQIQSVVTYGNNLSPKLVYPQTATVENNNIYSQAQTDQDRYLSIAFIK